MTFCNTVVCKNSFKFTVGYVSFLGKNRDYHAHSFRQFVEFKGEIICILIVDGESLCTSKLTIFESVITTYEIISLSILKPLGCTSAGSS